VRLTNTSKHNLRGPFKARVIGLKSDVGGQVAITSQSKREGVGALLNFSEATASTLQPGESTGVKRLVFNLTNLRPLAQGRDIKLNLLRLEMLVLGYVEK